MPVETKHEPEPPTEDLAQLLRRVMDQKDLTQLEIARRSGISKSTIGAWINRTRGIDRGPSRERLRSLAAAIGEPEDRVFAAADRKTPGQITPDDEEEVLEYYRELTAEQQRAKKIEMRALARDNQAGA